jgi:toxin ParE1/3/4
MPTLKLFIAPAAKSDLKEIYQYGLRQWGQAQSNSYLEKLKECFWSLRKQPLIGVERTDILSRVRSLPVESHTLFYRGTEDRIEVIRVLHGRQDPHRHFK